jgi:hypothetical protein
MATCGTPCPREIYLLPASTARTEKCTSVRPDYGVKPVTVVHVHRSVLPGCSLALSSPVAREGWGALSCSPVIIATTSSLHAWWVGTPPTTRPARITQIRRERRITCSRLWLMTIMPMPRVRWSRMRVSTFAVSLPSELKTTRNRAPLFRLAR